MLEKRLNQSWRRVPRKHMASFGVLALYGLFSILFTYPLIFRISHAIPDHDIDVWIGLWNDWWFRQAFFSDHSFYFTPFLFYPHGLSLVGHSNSLLFSAVSALWQPLLGPVAAYNLSTLLIFVIGAWGTYLLVCDLTGHKLAAFAGGLVYAFAPYHLTQALAHPNLASVQWFPYIALFLRRLMRQARWRDAVGAGISFALTVWSGLHLALLGTLWAGVFVAWSLTTTRRAHRPAALRALVASALVALVLSLPAIMPVLKSAPALEGLQHVERETGQTDLMAYVIPPRYHPLWGDRFAPMLSRFPKNRKWMAYLGIVPLALSLWAALKARREASFWWISGLLWVLLALGAFLRVNGQVYTGLRLPFSLFDQHFPFSTLRSADRFNLLVPLSLAVLVGLALSHINQRKNRWLGALLTGLIALEYLCVPLPVQELPPVSPFEQQIAADPHTYAVLDLPMGRRPSKLWMYRQTRHGRPMVEGMAGRTPPEAYAFIESQPLLRAFRHGQDTPPEDISNALDGLSEAGLRYILIHLNMASAGDVQRWRSWFPTSPVYEDGRLIVYAVYATDNGR